MNAPVTNLQDISVVDFLSNTNAKTMLLTGISWVEYERFLQTFWEKTNLSLTYNNGKLEIMPKSERHEKLSRSVYNFFLAYCEHFEIELEGRGSTTFRQKFLEKGVEPDECFYIQSVKEVIGKKFAHKDYPMPDVAIEIDLSTDSLDKFPIYAALQIAEVWVFDGKKVCFYQLDGEKYNQISNSIALTSLSSETLAEFLNLSETKGQTFALKSFRQRLNEIK